MWNEYINTRTSKYLGYQDVPIRSVDLWGGSNRQGSPYDKVRTYLSFQADVEKGWTNKQTQLKTDLQYIRVMNARRDAGRIANFEQMNRLIGCH